MHKIQNEWGYSLLECIKFREEELEKNIYVPIKSSIILVRYKNKFLIGYHKRRKQWEIPGGSIDEGEMPKQCIIRELYEETNQIIDDAEFVGLAKLSIDSKDQIEYLAIYTEEINNFIEFRENIEIKELMLWDGKEDIENFDSIEKAIMDFCIENKTF